MAKAGTVSRRALVALPLFARASDADSGRLTDERLNAFAHEYNAFITQMSTQGVVDMKRWQRVVKRFREMVPCE